MRGPPVAYAGARARLEAGSFVATRPLDSTLRSRPATEDGPSLSPVGNGGEGVHRAGEEVRLLVGSVLNAIQYQTRVGLAKRVITDRATAQLVENDPA